MWDPRDESASKVYFDSVVQRAMFLFPSSNTDARVYARACYPRVQLCIPAYTRRAEKMIKKLTDYLRFLRGVVEMKNSKGIDRFN